MTLKFLADEKWSKVLKSGQKWSYRIEYIFFCMYKTEYNEKITFGVVEFKEKFAWNLCKVVWEEKLGNLCQFYNYLLVNALSIIKSKNYYKVFYLKKNYYNVKNFEPDSSLHCFWLLFDHQCRSGLLTIFVPDSKPFWYFSTSCHFVRPMFPSCSFAYQTSSLICPAWGRILCRW